jgi:hypothetical protein
MHLRRLAVFALAVCTIAGGAQAQCRSADKPVAMILGIGGTPAQATVTQRLAVCTRHEFKLPVKAGQRIDLSLTSPSNQQGMMTLVAPSGDKPADGQNTWAGTATETGTYIIEIATDKTTTYTLRVSLRDQNWRFRVSCFGPASL